MENSNLLIESGLSEEQAFIYDALLEKGPQKASALSKWTGIKNGLTYKVLDQLKSMGLVVERGGKGTVAVFTASHPSLLLGNIERKEKEISLAKDILSKSLGGLVSKYNLIAGKPNVQFYEGVNGLEKIYEDIILEGKDILLIQSPFDSDIPEIDTIVQKQIKRQVSKNIHAKALTPHIDTTKEWVQHHDEKNLVTRHIIQKGELEIPAQILIYGKKVGISSVKNPLISTIIEDENITQTFKAMFEYMWNLSDEYNKKTIASFDQTNISQTE